MILALVALELGALLIYAAVKGISVSAAAVSGDNKKPGAQGSIMSASGSGFTPPAGLQGPVGTPGASFPPGPTGPVG